MIKGLLHQKQRPLVCNESMTHEALYFCSCHSEGFHVNTGTFIFLPPFALQIVHPLSKLNCNPAGTFLKAVCSFCWSVWHSVSLCCVAPSICVQRFVIIPYQDAAPETHRHQLKIGVFINWAPFWLPFSSNPKIKKNVFLYFPFYKGRLWVMSICHVCNIALL